MTPKPDPGTRNGNPWQRDPLIGFVVLAYALSWAVMLPMVYFRWPSQVMIAATFGPTLAAVLCSRLAADGSRFHLISPFRTLPEVLGLTLTGMAAVTLAYVVVPGIATADPHQLNWSILLSPGVYNYSSLLGGPLGEETGWRGFALPRLETRFGPTAGSLLLGLIWTGWHLPLFIRPGWESAPLWTYTMIIVGLSLIMSFFVNRARFSLATAIAMHLSFNTASRYLTGLFSKADPVTTLPFELVLAVSGLAVALLLVVATRGNLGFQPQSAPAGHSELHA